MVTGLVRIDYSQFELHTGRGGSYLDVFNVGLAHATDEDEDDAYVTLTAPRHVGRVPVDASYHPSAPPAEDAWDAAAEFSIRSGTAVSVSGWAGDDPILLPCPAGTELRVRYIVEDGQLSVDSDPDYEQAVERYRIQVWPEPSSPARVLASTSPWSQLWTFGIEARELVKTLEQPHPERLSVALDECFRRHPDVAAHICAGNASYLVGPMQYARSAIGRGHAEYSALQADRALLDALVEERARAASA